MRITKTLYATAALILMSGMPIAHADSLSDNKVVVNKAGDIVHSTKFRTCVRSKWEAGTDACAPAPEPEPVVEAPKPPVMRTILSKDEKTVYFNFDSAALTDIEKTTLITVAERLRKAEDVKSANIVGYADKIGSSDYNIRLSERRANVVTEFLKDQGYLKANVTEVRGLGETDSLTDCDSAMSRTAKIECLSKDRRVEVEVQYLNTELVPAE